MPWPSSSFSRSSPPPAASGAVPRDRQIRKVEAITTSAGALVRVTLRAPLQGRLRVGFERSDDKSGSTRRSAVIRGRRRTDFVFAGDARNLTRVIVRTAPRGDRATLRLPRVTDDCAALARARPQAAPAAPRAPGDPRTPARDRPPQGRVRAPRLPIDPARRARAGPGPRVHAPGRRASRSSTA